MHSLPLSLHAAMAGSAHCFHQHPHAPGISSTDTSVHDAPPDLQAAMSRLQSRSLPCRLAHGSHLQVLRDGVQDELYLQFCGLRPGCDLRAAVCMHALTVSECAHTDKIA